MKAIILAAIMSVALMPVIASALVVDTATVIKPNSTSAGHYIMLLNVTVDSLKVTDADVTFSGVSAGNDILNIFWQNGTIKEYHVISSGNITLPYTDNILYLLFSGAVTSTPPSWPAGSWPYPKQAETEPKDEVITINYNFAYVAIIIFFGYLIAKGIRDKWNVRKEKPKMSKIDYKKLFK